MVKTIKIDDKVWGKLMDFKAKECKRLNRSVGYSELIDLLLNEGLRSHHKKNSRSIKG